MRQSRLCAPGPSDHGSLHGELEAQVAPGNCPSTLCHPYPLPGGVYATVWVIAGGCVVQEGWSPQNYGEPQC